MRSLASLRRSDDGVVTTYVAIVATTLLFVAGLVVDGGGKITTYIRASNLAGSAARAGAQAADEGALYANGEVVIDLVEAEELAYQYLADAGYPGSGQVSVDGDTVTVTVSLTHDPMMLPVGTQEIQATESATAVRGVETGG